MSSKIQMMSSAHQSDLRELVQVDAVQSALRSFLQQREALIGALKKAAADKGKAVDFPSGQDSQLVQSIVTATTDAGDPVDAGKINQWLQSEYGMTHHTLA